MKLFNSKESVAGEEKVGGSGHLPFSFFRQDKLRMFFILLFMGSAVCFIKGWISEYNDHKALEQQQSILYDGMQIAIREEKMPGSEDIMEPEEAPGSEAVMEEEGASVSGNVMEKEKVEVTGADSEENADAELREFREDRPPVMLPEYEALYLQNEDFRGWLRIEDTVIDYPVMQCTEDENFYLSHDFFGKENKNGCLILDNDSHAGVGRKEQEYKNGSRPSTNLIIHGHTMKSGQMFGGLKKYQDPSYGLSHPVISFDSLYEKREYALLAVFYSQVYYQSEDVFKYYTFFQADTQEAFDDWYHNIKELSLYDTGVTAEWGDEFITLSCCAYHVEDGRFVVVGKRIDPLTSGK